ncbi:MAG: alanine racemase [Desulfobacterales bacterium]|nr:MAG: alanine racemase [Desulfobacterales bacterium]
MNFGAFAEINLHHLAHNVRAIQQRVFPSQIIPVVKADAYGHGAVIVTKRLVKEGFKYFAVAQFQEAMELRESGIHHPILIFGRLFPNEIPTAIKAGFRMTLFGKQDILWIEKAEKNQPPKIHVNLDTGMGRIGVLLDNEPDFFDNLTHSNHCVWEGLYSHFSTSDESDKSYANLQLGRFQKILTRINTNNSQPSMIHMANGGAILDIPESYFDAVRPGISLYGHYPSIETSQPIDLKQVMALKTSVAHIRKIPAGFSVSYGRRWTAEKPTTIAVLPIGYADGVRRSLTNIGEILIRGKRYPIAGTVTMDHIMVDIGHDSVKPGDAAMIWGDGPDGSIQVLEVAEKIGTIPYELTCGVSRRVKRVYIGDE